MPTSTQYEIVKSQVESFKPLGWFGGLEIQSMSNEAAPKILLYNTKKSYRFCDPDWDIVSKQLSTLYMNLKGKSN
jgi:hypothetical protein